MLSRELQSEQTDKYHIPDQQFTWPLFGTGLENLGKDGKPVTRCVPEYSCDELLMRIDSLSLCYTDVKEVNLGDNHPRLKERDLQSNPIIPGHEVSLTVIGVGSDLREKYSIGQRFTLQPDIWVNGKSVPFSFGMDGGYRQFAVIDKRIMNGDAGNYLIPIPNDMSYAAAAITEPWACVEASYRMKYRMTLKKNGHVLFYGDKNNRSGYQIDEAWIAKSAPASFYICDIPQDLKITLNNICLKYKIKFYEFSRSELETFEGIFDDIVLLDSAVYEVSIFHEKLAKKSIIALLLDQSDNQKIQIDVGRLHYDDLFYVGTDNLNITDAYTRTPVDPEFKTEGTAYILGAGGPMGRMHVQRAIESSAGPQKILTSNVTPARVISLKNFFVPLARKYKKDILITNPISSPDEYKTIMNNILDEGGVDDIEVMVNKPQVIEDACQYLGKNGIVNIFAGMKRGVSMSVDPWLIAGEMQIRFIGHSGSGLEDQKAVVDRCMSGELDTNLSVAAIGGLLQIPEGLQAMINSTFPGKIVIFPQIFDFPLTGLDSLDMVLPKVAELLGENNTWNNVAEFAFFESQLS